jgi:RIO kinase 2
MLSRWRELDEPMTVLEEVLVNVQKAYQDAGIIHGDLSEYNIILNPDMHILIIDWPQAVHKDHPNADDFLRRDVKNVLDFFVRKYRIKVSFGAAYGFVLGKTKKLTA